MEKMKKTGVKMLRENEQEIKYKLILKERKVSKNEKLRQK